MMIPASRLGGRGGGSRSIYFVSHAKGQLGSVQATGHSTGGAPRHETGVQWSQQLSANITSIIASSEGRVIWITLPVYGWTDHAISDFKLLFEFLSAGDDIIANICVYKAGASLVW